MNSNLPPGAENDSRAPWNDTSDYCRICDYKDLEKLAEEQSEATGHSFDDCIALLIDSTPICKYCYYEQLADDNED